MPRKTPAFTGRLLQAGSISQFWVTPSDARFVAERFLPTEVSDFTETRVVEHGVLIREEAILPPLAEPFDESKNRCRVVACHHPPFRQAAGRRCCWMELQVAHNLPSP